MYFKTQQFRLLFTILTLVICLALPFATKLFFAHDYVVSAQSDAVSITAADAHHGVNNHVYVQATVTLLPASTATATPTPTNLPDVQQTSSPTPSPTPCVPNSSSGGSQQAPQEVMVPDTLLGLCIDEKDQFFKFDAKAGKAYAISTDANPPNIDTHLFLYADGLPVDLNSGWVAENDDISSTNINSLIQYQAAADRAYFIRVVNTNGAKGTYTLNIQLVVPPTATPTATSVSSTRLPGDDLEDNFSFETAAVIAPDTEYELNFVPVTGDGPDNDFFRLWVKEHWYYSCETLDLSPYNDTNMIIYDQNKNGLAGNDDKKPNDLGSKVNYVATYTGWLYLLVGPNIEVPYTVSDQYTYTLSCTSSFGTPTPTPWPTIDPAILATREAVAATAAAEATANAPTPTPIPITTPITVTTETEIENEEFANSIIITELEPEAAEEPIPVFFDKFVVIVFATDQNGLRQGVGNMPIALYDESGQLIGFGYTNLQGRLTLDVTSDNTIIDVLIPYLGVRQTVNFPVTKAIEFTIPAIK